MNSIFQRLKPRLRRLYVKLNVRKRSHTRENSEIFLSSIDELSYGRLDKYICITGWIYSQELRHLSIEIDGVVVDSFVPDKERDDVRSVYGHIPAGTRLGFNRIVEIKEAWFNNRGTSSVAVCAHIGLEKHVLDTSSVFISQHYPAAKVFDKQEQNFYITVGSSNISLGGFGDFYDKLSPFSIGACQLGFMVPLLYMRSTYGKAQDWAFDPEFDEKKTQVNGKPVIADNLASILEFSKTKQVPCIIGLNGGIWGDASGTCPEWDLTDRLEEEPDNCQWNQHDKVMPDDHLKHLTGAEHAPELSRALTLSHYNEQVRGYKKRNLQQAAEYILKFSAQHPELYLGSNLDPDCYQNPFFEGEQWYDFNPYNIQQFRDWLSGQGAYAAELQSSISHQPYTLKQLNTELGTNYQSWQDVQPPREHPSKPVVGQTLRILHLWEQFRRHVVHRHYSDLADWLIEAGMPAAKIFSSQGFTAPRYNSEPFALSLDSPVKNYDSGGMSLAGSKPVNGHVGAIFYGESARNNIRTENSVSFFQNIRMVDKDWAVVEFNPADLRDHPKDLPDYAFAWDCLRQIYNHGARYINLMAWNGNSGRDADKDFFSAHMALRDTPLQTAVMDFMLMHSDVPRGTVCYTFGSNKHGCGEGWSSPDAVLAAKGTGLTVTSGRQARLRAPQPYLLYDKKSLSVKFHDTCTAIETIKVFVDGKVLGGVGFQSQKAYLNNQEVKYSLSLPEQFDELVLLFEMPADKNQLLIERIMFHD